MIAAALAIGNTKVIMFANCFKFVGLGLAVVSPSSGLRIGRRCCCQWLIGQILHHGLFFLFCLITRLGMKSRNPNVVIGFFAFIIACGTSL